MLLECCDHCYCHSKNSYNFCLPINIFEPPCENLLYKFYFSHKYSLITYFFAHGLVWFIRSRCQKITLCIQHAGYERLDQRSFSRSPAMW